MPRVTPGGSGEASQPWAQLRTAAPPARVQFIRLSTFPGYESPHPREVKPAATIAYPATMVKQSRLSHLHLSPRRQPQPGHDRGT